MKHLQAPNGGRIIGTLEHIPGTSGIDEETLKDNGDGTFSFDHDGNGTNVDWDGQKTVTRLPHDGSGREAQRMFVDEDGTAWPEYLLKLVDEED